MTTDWDRRFGAVPVLRRVAAPIALLAVLLGGALSASQPAAQVGPVPLLNAAAVFSAAAVPLPASCRPNPSPPPTEYGFVARVTDGTVAGPGPLRITDIDVSVCGVVRLINAQSGSGCTGIQARLIVPAEGVVTNDLNASLAIAGMPPMENVPTEVTATPMSSDVSCADSGDGLSLDLNLRITGSAGIFGLECKVPVTGTVRATVTGPLLSPPYEGETTITGEVAVGGVSNNDKFCPGRLPARLNAVADLPGSGYQVDWPTTVAIYQP